MSDREGQDGYRSRVYPRGRDGAHDARTLILNGNKASPFLSCKNRKEQMEMADDSPAKATCSSNVGNLEICRNSTFDICVPHKPDIVRLNLSLFEINREKRKELEQAKMGPQCSRLQRGMILLKHYLKHQDQVHIIRECRKLGIGSGGFYRPGYRDGAKLNLQMMCLGKNWDPQTRSYEDIRPIDGAKAPEIPSRFRKLVEEAIQTSYSVINQHPQACHPPEAELPVMSPDICIVNFYEKTGKLGLHQDRDESRESLDKGLPVVSFSLGDSADFLYGETRDVERAARVKLENGDALVFGGESRLVFHGVPCIHPGTAPKRLVEETKLRPGRLNLTFRRL